MKKEKIQINPHSALIQQGYTFILIILVLLSLYWFMRKPAAGQRSDSDGAVLLSSKYCTLMRPPGFKGKLIGNTFMFKKDDNNFIIAVNHFASQNFVFTALKKNRDYMTRLIKNQAVELNIKLKKIAINNIEDTMFNFTIPSLKTHFKTARFQGDFILFYSNDVRFIYMAIYKKTTSRNKYIARVFMDYVTLKPPLNIPLYKRPVIQAGQIVDSASLLARAKIKTQEAIALWHNADEAPDNVLHAMKNFQEAMKLTAEAGLGGGFTKKHAEIIDIYSKCRKYRKEHLNKMKSEIIQAQHLGNKTLAKEVARELAETASLDNETAIRSWAKKQIGK